MPRHRDRPKDVLALSQKTRKKLPKRDSVRPIVPLDPWYYKICGRYSYHIEQKRLEEASAGNGRIMARELAA